MENMLEDKVNELPLSPGVYLFKDQNGVVIYVGKSIRLRDRVKSYFALKNTLEERTLRLVENIADIDTIETESEIEALLVEAELIKKYLPEFNQLLKDDKRYKYIKIVNAGFRKRNGIKKTVNKKLWPYVTTTRKDEDDDALCFGPFPAGRTVYKVLRILRRLFPYCDYRSGKAVRRNNKGCFYHHIGLCPGICVNEISLKEYWKIIDDLVLFLRGGKKKILDQYVKRMKKASKQKEYESAAYYRDLISELEYVTQQFHDAQDFIQNPNLKQDQRIEEINELVKIISDYYSIKITRPEDFRIEGYDISNLGKDYTVGSRVVFIGGDPDRSEYRRYRIRHEKLPDDFAAMREVITRRLRKNDDLPDLILIDGGKGQLSEVLRVIKKQKLGVLALGLAKKHETIVLPRPNQSSPDGFVEVRISKSSPAVQLLMRIRDESHRFSQNYHKLLRKKALQSK